MLIDVQPVLENEVVRLQPLVASDLEALYAVASDPKIWEQHPSNNRWQRPIFQTFFDGAMESKGAFLIIDKASGDIAGSSRFYNYIEVDKSIMIGYTFYACRFWGSGLNPMVKRLMMDHIFQFVDKVQFQIGTFNLRSQIAIGRLGAAKIGEEDLAYHGEPSKPNFVYEIRKTAASF